MIGGAPELVEWLWWVYEWGIYSDNLWDSWFPCVGLGCGGLVHMCAHIEDQTQGLCTPGECPIAEPSEFQKPPLLLWFCKWQSGMTIHILFQVKQNKAACKYIRWGISKICYQRKRTKLKNLSKKLNTSEEEDCSFRNNYEFMIYF